MWRVTAETPADDPADPTRFDRPIGESLTATLHLTRDEAEILLRGLYDLWQRFDGHGEDEVGRKAYHFGFDMVEIGS